MANDDKDLQATPPKRSSQKKSGKKKPNKNKKTQSARAEAPKKKWWRKLIQFTFALGLWLGLVGSIALTAVFFTLPDPLSVINEQRRPPTINLLDRYGDPFHQIRGHAAQPARIQDLPPLVPAAFLAMEDRRFYNHFGVDPLGIARAAWSNLMAGGIRQGGSTITQQVAKNIFLTPKRTLFRKLQEAMLALWLEQKFSKQQILEIYLNRIYLGSGVYGIAAGAQQYFGKSANELNLTDMTLLAGLPKAPSRYSPLANPKAAQKRAITVLEILKKQNLITNNQYNHTREELRTIQNLPVRRVRGAHFHRWIMQQLEDLNILSQSDLTVYTTFDPDLQRNVENQLTDFRATLKKQNVEQAAIVSMDSSGAIRAMLGSVPWENSQFNRATQARRQVGSVFKVIVFAAALEAGYTPDTNVKLVRPKDIEQWWPEDSIKNNLDSVDLRTGMAQSSNALAVTLSQAVGRKNLITMARRMGISSIIPNLPSIALGVAEIPLIEMTSAIAIIANNGISAEPYGISHIVDSTGQIVSQHTATTHRVIDSDTAKNMQNILSAVINIGTGKAARSQSTLGGKTGTTQNHRDALFIGYGADLVTGVWLGNDTGSAMQKTSGGGLPAQIFAGIAQVYPH